MSEQGMSGYAGQGAGGMGQGGADQGGTDQGGSGQGGSGQGGSGQGGMHHGSSPQSQPQAGVPYWPPYVPYGYPPQQMMGYPPGMDQMAGPQAGQGMAQVVNEIANGGNGLSSLSKLLDFNDKDFWKGALVGAAAVLLLTNESVQKTLFRGAVKGRDAVDEGVEKVKEGVGKVKQKVREVKEKGDE